MRRALSSGISNKWIKGFSQVLETPKWNFDTCFEYNNVIYTHGEGGGGINGALSKALNRRKSIVQGHWHSEAHIRYNTGSVASDYKWDFLIQNLDNPKS